MTAAERRGRMSADASFDVTPLPCSSSSPDGAGVQDPEHGMCLYLCARVSVCLCVSLCVMLHLYSNDYSKSIYGFEW